MQIIVGIATAGRRELMPHTIDFLRRQTRLPDAIFICPAKESDYDITENINFPCPIQVVKGGQGLPAQRNVIMRNAKTADIIVFYDDDFLPEPSFLAELEELFVNEPGMVLATGDVVADGATGPGISLADAVREIEQLGPLPQAKTEVVFNAYGCNMAIRMASARENGIEFDEILPLYAWWEDVDFSRRMAPFGGIVKSNRLRGVHMGSKSGRTPGQRLGYSQVANIAYMIQKGSVPFGVGAIRIARNVFANSVRQFRAEPWVDRKGRFIGNIKALLDCVKAPADPQKIFKL